MPPLRHSSGIFLESIIFLNTPKYMRIAEVQFSKWDKVYDFSLGHLELKAGNMVVVDTELGQEIGEVVRIVDKKDVPDVLKPVERLATQEDLAKLPSKREKAEIVGACRDLITKHNLPMKLIDVHSSFSGNRLNFAFIADGRVDFRDLVKDLTYQFNKTIRLTQIGIRDEARFSGDCGHCGRPLCCRGFLKDFSSISSEMAEAQQVIHRGSERISGCCGRLMCCLSYEYEGYRDLASKLPMPGDKVNVDGKRGTVVGCQFLKQSVSVEIDDAKEGRMIIDVDYSKKG